jgi:predicted transcriptional regulator
LQSGSEQEEACPIIQADKTPFTLIKCVALAGKDTYIDGKRRIEEEKSMTENANAGDLLALTTEIVAAHVSNNTVTVADLPQLINQVYQSLSTIGTGPAPAAERPQPAVNIKKSVFPDYIVCLEDGKKLKMLKRHLKTAYNLTPEEYRERWGLPADYPMVAPNYAKQRSKLAKEIGLGTRARRPGVA